jgi:hypothetical protein
MSVKIYTYGNILEYVNKILKGEGIANFVTADMINSSVQSICNGRELWFLKTDFDLEFSYNADNYIVTKSLPENIQNIKSANIKKTRNRIKITDKTSFDTWVNNYGNDKPNKNIDIVCIIGDTCLLNDDLFDKASVLTFYSLNNSDISQNITFIGIDNDGFSITETKNFAGQTPVPTSNTFKKITNFYLSASTLGNVIIKNSDDDILIQLPAEKTRFKTLKIQAYPVLKDTTVNFIGYRKVISYDNSNDIPDFPQEFIPSVLINKILMNATAWNKDSHTYQSTSFEYQESLKEMLNFNNTVFKGERL